MSFMVAIYQVAGFAVTITPFDRAVFRVVASYLEDDAGRSPPCLEWTGLPFVFQAKLPD